MKWYGSVINRIEEQAKGAEPQVGLGVTEYLWSDRHAYEITQVTDSKHFKMMEYDVENIGGSYSNDWKLISNPDNYEYDMVFRYGSWWRKQKCAYRDDYEYVKMNIVIGKADYYYDYEF